MYVCVCVLLYKHVISISDHARSFYHTPVMLKCRYWCWGLKSGNQPMLLKSYYFAIILFCCYNHTTLFSFYFVLLVSSNVFRRPARQVYRLLFTHLRAHIMSCYIWCMYEFAMQCQRNKHLDLIDKNGSKWCKEQTKLWIRLHVYNSAHKVNTYIHIGYMMCIFEVGSLCSTLHECLLILYEICLTGDHTSLFYQE